MRPILSATGTYGYPKTHKRQLAMRPILSATGTYNFFTNVPLDETIDILARKAFENNWFNNTYDLNLARSDLVDMLYTLLQRGSCFSLTGLCTNRPME